MDPHTSEEATQRHRVGGRVHGIISKGSGLWIDASSRREKDTQRNKVSWEPLVLRSEEPQERLGCSPNIYMTYIRFEWWRLLFQREETNTSGKREKRLDASRSNENAVPPRPPERTIQQQYYSYACNQPKNGSKKCNRISNNQTSRKRYHHIVREHMNIHDCREHLSIQKRDRPSFLVSSYQVSFPFVLSHDRHVGIAFLSRLAMIDYFWGFDWMTRFSKSAACCFL